MFAETNTDETLAPSEPEERPRSSVGIVMADERWASIDGLESLLSRAVEIAICEAREDDSPATLDLALSSDEEVRSLNAAYRGKDKPTNVLSFPAADIPHLGEENASAPVFLGDVIMAYETIAAEAGAEGKTLPAHAAHLAVHGALHLLSYGHETDAEAAEMEALEIAILARLGIPDPYGDPAP
jgi:probable rRNA maturation factor